MRRETAFQLIVISLSQGELSRDRAHTEQFSSQPIRDGAVNAEWLNERRRGKNERQTPHLTDRHTRREYSAYIGDSKFSSERIEVKL